MCGSAELGDANTAIDRHDNRPEQAAHGVLGETGGIVTGSPLFQHELGSPEVNDYNTLIWFSNHISGTYCRQQHSDTTNEGDGDGWYKVTRHRARLGEVRTQSRDVRMNAIHYESRARMRASHFPHIDEQVSCKRTAT